jgi:hypothetical protein
MGAPSGAGTASLSGVPDFSPFCQWGSASVKGIVLIWLNFALWSMGKV